VLDLRPHHLSLRRQIDLRFNVDPKLQPNAPNELTIVRQRTDGGWEPLRTTWDDLSNELIASSDKLGVFAVRKADALVASQDSNQPLRAQNYPNPFNAGTVISCTLSEPDHIRLVIFNILGQEITTLHDGYLSIGEHQIYWDGTNDDDRDVASGVYFYRLQGTGNAVTRKMVLVR
jgi:hypothetical protein